MSYGDLPAMLTAAHEELAAGRTGNALAAYQECLCQWLRNRWVEHTGRPNSTIYESVKLVEKLRGAGRIDRWTRDFVCLALVRADRPSRLHVEVVAGLVAALTLQPTEGKA